MLIVLLVSGLVSAWLFATGCAAYQDTLRGAAQWRPKGRAPMPSTAHDADVSPA
jgi:hypothetical protein